MKQRSIPRIAAISACVLAILTGSAFAFYSSKGGGTAAAAVTSLSAPTLSKAEAAVGGTVKLEWGAVGAPNGGTVKYYVTRNNGLPAESCPDVNEAENVTTCTDTGLNPGTYEYKVIAVWSSWSKASAVKTATVSVGVATRFTVTAASATPSTGAADNLTITAKDSANTTVTSYKETHELVFSGASASALGAAPTVTNATGTAVPFGEKTALTFTSGVAQVTSGKNGAMQIYKPGEANIVATEGSLTTPTAATVNVVATATRFTLTSSSTSPAAGEPVSLTITASDAYGNQSTTYIGSHNLIFAGASSSPGGNAPTVENSSGTPVAFGTATALNFSAGVATVAESKNGEMRLYKSGETNVTATEGSVTTPTPLTVTVGVTAKYFALTASSTTPAAGTAVNLTIKANDAYGNLVTTYTGSHSLTFSGASNSPSGTAPTVVDSAGTAVTFGTATTLNFSAGSASVNESKNGVMTLYKSGETSITATDGTLTTPVALVETVSATAKNFVLTSSSTTPAAGAAVNLTIKVNDAFGNLATTYTGSHNLTFSGASNSPGGNAPTVENSSGTPVAFGTATAITFSAGVATVAEGKNGEMILYASGSPVIKATEGSLTTPTGLTMTVSPLATSSFALTSSATSFATTSAPNLTITARDTYGNTTPSYKESHNLTFTASGTGSETSPSGAVPGIYNAAGTLVPFGSTNAITFTNGVATGASNKNGTLRLYKVGTANINVSDGTFSGSLSGLTVTAGAGKVAFTSLTVTAGTISNPCYFTCTVTGLGNSGTITSKITIADEFQNVLQNVGSGKTVTIAGSGFTITGSPVALPETGAATTTTTFTAKSPASGSFTTSITATSSGYTTGTITASK